MLESWHSTVYRGYNSSIIVFNSWEIATLKEGLMVFISIARGFNWMPAKRLETLLLQILRR
jgi:hypothetical protein